MSIDNRYIAHPALTTFAALADEYCTLIEMSLGVPREELLVKIHRLLPRIYAAGLDLPSTSVLFNDDADSAAECDNASVQKDTGDPDGLTHQELQNVFESLIEKLGNLVSYREVYDPYDPPKEGEVIASLADDIADIYRDLLSGLRKWKQGESGKALWEWRFRLESHWGEHATGALRALFARSAWHDLPWPEPS